MIDRVIDFILGNPPHFHVDPGRVRPGDKFARCEDLRGKWVYVEVLALSGGELPLHARAYSQEVPSGFEGHCALDELHFRVDDVDWERIRANGWGPPVAGLNGAPAARPLDH